MDLDEIAKTTLDDFYALLGLGLEPTEAEIKRQYRKTALEYHPDKRPDDELAAEKFHLLSVARDILIDARLKGEYDGQRQRRKERELEKERLGGQRRKMVEELEKAERNGIQNLHNLKRKRAEDLDEQQARLQKLAEDGKRRRQELQEKREREERERQEQEASFMEPSPEAEAKPQGPEPGHADDLARSVHVKFKREGEAVNWDKEHLKTMFSKYGAVDNIPIFKEKKVKVPGEKHKKIMVTAFVLYTRLDHAYTAVADAKSDYPLLESVSWTSKEPDIKPPTHTGGASAPSTPLSTPNKAFRSSFGLGKGLGSAPGTPKFFSSPKTTSLEELTHIRLKQREKEKLEEQIRRQEAEEEAKESAQAA